MSQPLSAHNSGTPLRRSERKRTTPRSVAGQETENEDVTISSLGWLRDEIKGRATMSFGGYDDRRATLGSIAGLEHALRRETLGGIDELREVLAAGGEQEEEDRAIAPRTPPESPPPPPEDVQLHAGAPTDHKPLKSCLKSTTRARKLSVAFGTPQGMFFDKRGPVTDKMTPMELDLAAKRQLGASSQDESEDESTAANSRILDDFEAASGHEEDDEDAEVSARSAAAAAAAGGARSAERRKTMHPSPSSGRMSLGFPLGFPLEFPLEFSMTGPMGLGEIAAMTSFSAESTVFSRAPSSPTLQGPVSLRELVLANTPSSPTMLLPPRLSEIVRADARHDLHDDGPDHLDDVLLAPAESGARSPTMLFPPRMSEVLRGGLDRDDDDDHYHASGRSPTMDHPPRLSELACVREEAPPSLSAIARASLGGEDATDTFASLPLQRSPTMLNPPRMSEIMRGHDEPEDGSFDRPDSGSLPSAPRRSPTMDRPLRLSELVHADKGQPGAARASVPMREMLDESPIRGQSAPASPQAAATKSIGECLEFYFGPAPAAGAAVAAATTAGLADDPPSGTSARQPTAADVQLACIDNPLGRTREFIVQELGKTALSRIQGLDAEVLALPWSETAPAAGGTRAVDSLEEAKELFRAAVDHAQAELDSWVAKVLDGTQSSLDKHQARLEDDLGTLKEWARQARDAAGQVEVQRDAQEQRLLASERAGRLQVRLADEREALASVKRKLEACRDETKALEDDRKRLRVHGEAGSDVQQSLARLELDVDMALVNLDIHQGLCSWRVVQVTSESVTLRTVRDCELLLRFGQDGRVSEARFLHEGNPDPSKAAVLDKLIGAKVATAGLVIDLL